MTDNETTSPLHEEASPEETNPCWGTVNTGLQVSLDDIKVETTRDNYTGTVNTRRHTESPSDDDSVDNDFAADGMTSTSPPSPPSSPSIAQNEGAINREKETKAIDDQRNGSLLSVERKENIDPFTTVDMTDDNRKATHEATMFESENVRQYKQNIGGMSLAQVVELAQKKERKHPNPNLGGWRKVKQLVRGIADMKRSMLIHTNRQRLEERDFHREVRPAQDIKNFMNEATVLFNLPDSNLHDVINPMIKKLIENEPAIKLEEAKRAIFTEDSCSLLTNTLQSSVMLGGGLFFEDSWLCAFASLKNLHKRHVAIGRLKRPTNLGFTCTDVRFVVLVLAPTVEKGTKNSLETAITFSTLFTDINFRVSLWEEAENEEEFLDILQSRVDELSDNRNVRNVVRRRESQNDQSNPFHQADTRKRCTFFKGIREDVKRRIRHYRSDFEDGISGGLSTVGVMVTTVVFLYFSCLLFTLSLGVLNDKNTNHHIGVRKALAGQVIAGLVCGIFGGQPLMVVATSAPLALFTKVIYMLTQEQGWDFYVAYGAIGIFSSGFIILFAVIDVSKFMKWSTRSVDEVFTVFVACTLIKEAINALLANFETNYTCLQTISTAAYDGTNISITNANDTVNITFTNTTTEGALINHAHKCLTIPCHPENSILFVLLMIGVPWIGITLFRFKRSPYLATIPRELLSNQALAISVLLWSFIATYCFKDVHLKPFPYHGDNDVFTIPEYGKLGYSGWLASTGLGLSHALMVFMEHNITGSIVNSPENKLKKGTSYHWDLLLCGLLNLVFAIFGLPMVHGIVPLSPMHVRSLAVVEERVNYGYVQTIIVRVRETRLTLIIAHVFLGVSFLLLPLPLQYIPMSVLAGVYIFIAIQSFIGNQFFERLILFITEQNAYPPSHYVRRVPQRKMHLFTFIELLELVVLCVFGISSIIYMKMVFPFLLIIFIPIRHFIIPKVIEKKYLASLDHH
ncbi:solute carrier family 4 member 11-like [Glandiceps talaboti]